MGGPNWFAPAQESHPFRGCWKWVWLGAEQVADSGSRVAGDLRWWLVPQRAPALGFLARKRNQKVKGWPELWCILVSSCFVGEMQSCVPRRTSVDSLALYSDWYLLVAPGLEAMLPHPVYWWFEKPVNLFFMKVANLEGASFFTVGKFRERLRFLHYSWGVPFWNLKGK